MSLHEDIARVAYEIYEKNGRQNGRAVSDWLEAEKIVKAGSAGPETPGTAKPRKAAAKKPAAAKPAAKKPAAAKPAARPGAKKAASKA